jgi:hypothetical protein
MVKKKIDSRIRVLIEMNKNFSSIFNRRCSDKGRDQVKAYFELFPHFNYL